MNHQSIRLGNAYFRRDVLEVAPGLLGKNLVRAFPDGSVIRYAITETEAYSGNGDLACHASKGLTPRTEVMFRPGGLVYVYLIYGMYWMLNIVTGGEGEASAVLIRGVGDIDGPGKTGRALQLDRSFYGEDLETSTRIWIEDTCSVPSGYTTHPRVGIHYAGEPWISKPWRYRLLNTGDRNPESGIRRPDMVINKGGKGRKGRKGRKGGKGGKGGKFSTPED